MIRSPARDENTIDLSIEVNKIFAEKLLRKNNVGITLLTASTVMILGNLVG